MIRDATLDDVPAMSRMSARFWNEVQYGSLSGFLPAYVPEGHIEQLKALVRNENAILLTDGENCLGFAMLYPLDADSTKKACKIMYWWAAPEARGRLGIELFREIERRAVEAGACVGMASAAEESKGGSVGRFLERNGYHAVDINYAKGLG